MRVFVLVATLSFAVFLGIGCATSGVTTPQSVSERIRKETGHPTRDAAGDAQVPAGISLEDGLTETDAIAIALWNNTGFQESLADLGIARADLAQAGLLRNPVLSLLLPWGPKQLEATARWPIDALWQRPNRVAAARLNAEAVGERLVAHGLNLVADTRIAFVTFFAHEPFFGLRRRTRSSRGASLVYRAAGSMRATSASSRLKRPRPTPRALNSIRGLRPRRRRLRKTRFIRSSGSAKPRALDQSVWPMCRSRQPHAVTLRSMPSNRKHWRRDQTCAPPSSTSRPPAGASDGSAAAFFR